LQGASNKEIADSNSISERTVKTHLYRVYRKLNVKSRTKAIALLAHS
jgi:DNA-binding CsgD family transcriptional regulator